MSVKLVIFDMDGVVIDSEKVYFRSNQLAAEELGIKGFTMEYYRQFVGAGTEHMIEKMTEDYGDRDLVERFVRLSMDKVYPVVEAGELELRPGFTELSAYLRESGIPFTLASSNYMVPDVIPAGEFEREHTVAVLDDLVCVKNYIEKENK